MAITLQVSPASQEIARRPRNWKTYNEHLVQRGQVDIYLESLEHWDDDLRSINAGKAGHPFTFPGALFFVACMLRFLFSISYRSLEGLLRSLARRVGFDVPCYTTIFRRCQQVDLREWLPQQKLSGPVTIAIDSSGIKVDNHGEWLREKWGDNCKSRRGWVKLHVAVNAGTHEALAVVVTREDVGDQQEFVPLVQGCLDAGIKVERALGDRIFDCKDIHNFLARQRIQPGIPPRKNARRRSRGSPSRAAGGRFYQDLGEKAWKETRKYAKRVAAERVFSAFKQLFGERVMAKKWEQVVHELKSKFWVLNWNLTRPLLAPGTRPKRG